MDLKGQDQTPDTLADEKNDSNHNVKDLELRNINGSTNDTSFITSVTQKQSIPLYYVDWFITIFYHFDIVVHCVQLTRESLKIESKQAYKDDQPYHEEKVQKLRGFLVSGLQFGIPTILYLTGLRAKLFDT